jgi:hypothetical protein
MGTVFIALVLFTVAVIILVLATGPIKLKIKPRLTTQMNFSLGNRYEEISEDALSEPVRACFNELDAKMSALSFSPAKTLTQSGHAGMNFSPLNTITQTGGGFAVSCRLYANGAECVNLLASCLPAARSEGFQNIAALEFSTQFSDGSIVLTNNFEAERLFPDPASKTVNNFPGEGDHAKLFESHKKAVDKKKAANLAPVYISPDEALDHLNKSVKQGLDDAVARGLLTFNPMDNTYSPTAKLVMNAPVKPHVSVNFKVNKKEQGK